MLVRNVAPQLCFCAILGKKLQKHSISMSEASGEGVEALLTGIDRYNPENTPVLEEFVDQQCSEGVFHLDANLALLKL